MHNMVTSIQLYYYGSTPTGTLILTTISYFSFLMSRLWLLLDHELNISCSMGLLRTITMHVHHVHVLLPKNNNLITGILQKDICSQIRLDHSKLVQQGVVENGLWYVTLPVHVYFLELVMCRIAYIELWPRDPSLIKPCSYTTGYCVCTCVTHSC